VPERTPLPPAHTGRARSTLRNVEGRGPGQPPAAAPTTDAARLRALAVQLDELLPFAGRATVVLASLALIVALFLPWYDFPTVVPFEDGAPDSPNGWQAFRYADIYLTCVAATGIGSTAVAAALRFRAPFAVSGLAGWIGVAIVIYSYYRPYGVAAYTSPDLGYFVAICASGAITGGSLMSLIGRRTGASTP
jgi:hypothetical protein